MDFKYRVIVNKRRKTIGIKIISPEEILICSPYGVSKKYIDKIINLNIDDIRDRILEIKKKSMPSILERDSLYVLGSEVLFEVIYWGENRSYLKYDGQSIKIYINKDLAKDEKEIKKLIITWYKKIAKEYLKKLVLEMAKQYEFEINDIRIKDVKTRWGSCSTRRNINLNYKLIMAPKEVIEYVIIHELCHLKEMNHSKLFWKEVSVFIPNYKYYIDYLKNNGYKYEL